MIHGMGEQRPMDTLRGFVRSVWELDSKITANGLPNPAEVWSKPDLRTGSLELRRITTRQSIPTHTFSDGVRSDFYEADLRSPPRAPPSLLSTAMATLWVEAIWMTRAHSISSRGLYGFARYSISLPQSVSPTYRFTLTFKIARIRALRFIAAPRLHPGRNRGKV